MKLLFLLYLTASIVGATEPDYCNIKLGAPVKIISPLHPPDYFFKASADGKYVYYISKEINYRINTDTGIEEKIPGNLDPVPSADGKILTYLDSNKNISIVPLNPNGTLDISKTIKDQVRSYQSIGIRGNSYRIFSEVSHDKDPEFNSRKTLWKYQDYTLDKDSIKSNSKAVVIPNSEDYRLGLINKPGDTFTAFNTETMKTDIISVETGKIQDTLPVGSGKADFSFDDQKIVFHLTSNAIKDEINQELKMGVIQKENQASRNIFVYDRNSKKVKRITDFKEGNAFFPVFLKNDQIINLYKDLTSGKFEFHLVNEPEESRRSIADIQSCLGHNVTDQNLNMLSEKWMKICKKLPNHENKEIAKKAILNLPEKYCLMLGQDQSDISKFCTPIAGSVAKISLERQKKLDDKDNELLKKLEAGGNILQNKCLICHAEFPDSKKIKERINSNDPQFRMPKIGQLTDKEKSELETYLKLLLPSY